MQDSCAALDPRFRRDERIMWSGLLVATSSLGSTLGCRRAPYQQASLDDADYGVDHDDENCEHEHAGENSRHVEYALRLLDQIAEAGGRAQVFTNDRAHNCKADRGVQRG